jgi:hypothetical protein
MRCCALEKVVVEEDLLCQPMPRTGHQRLTLLACAARMPAPLSPLHHREKNKPSPNRPMALAVPGSTEHQLTQTCELARFGRRLGDHSTCTNAGRSAPADIHSPCRELSLYVNSSPEPHVRSLHHRQSLPRHSLRSRCVSFSSSRRSFSPPSCLRSPAMTVCLHPPVPFLRHC